MAYKSIHIGTLIHQRVKESNMDMKRITHFFKCCEEQIQKHFESKDIRCDDLLKWSKLLEYDFFRIYSQHLILHAPQRNVNYNKRSSGKTSSLPQFRKNIYTKEIIEFILEKVNNGKMSKNEIMDQYNIPKTTLYKWIYKHDKSLIRQNETSIT
ncbi:transposase [uncultured Chryseobacterium sp.]|uniref:transposase n=1 Tax=uncultured Chryseobacterium sp. TaxID=259322 RepID=UPI00258C8DE1|nr:transposase [uncultured Chryseobacterium sp.]